MKLLQKFYPALILVSLTIIFFNTTLTGREIFVTPDFGLSDILHNEYPLKLFMSQSLKNHELPFWNPQIGAGFPLDGYPSGLFNPINLLIFYLLPMPAAYNISLAVIFLTAAAGTYLFTRSIKLSQESSLLAAICFSFSGIFITQIVHFSVIQTLSYFPFELYLAEFAFQKRKLSFAILIAIPVALQILTGFFQVVLYSLIFLISYVIYKTISTQKPSKKIAVFIFTGITLGFLIGAIQLIPSWQFVAESNRREGVSQIQLEAFPYPVKHLVTFIWPYLLGDPRNGTYSVYSKKWGLFWENTGYIGLLPLILAIIATYFLTKKDRRVLFFSVMALITFLLMLGKNSPIYFLYNFLPLSLFRVPARWIIFLTFSLSLLSAFGSEHIIGKLSGNGGLLKMKKILIPVSFLIIIVNLFFFGLNYNPRGNADAWLKETETTKFLKKDNSAYRVYSIGNKEFWNQEFIKNGWQPTNSYISLLENPEPNWNVVQGLNHLGIYGILTTHRQLKITNILELTIKKTKDGYSITTPAQNVLSLGNVKYLISPFKLEGGNFELVFSTGTEPQQFVYLNKSALPRVYFPKTYTVINPNDNLITVISGSFDPKTNVILENDPKLNLKDGNWDAEITKYENKKIEINAKGEKDGLLVFSDTYYKGWKTYVDGKKTEIIPANINSRAIALKEGSRKIQMVYDNPTFKFSVLISLVSLVLTISISLYFGGKKQSTLNHPA